MTPIAPPSLVRRSPPSGPLGSPRAGADGTRHATAARRGAPTPPPRTSAWAPGVRADRRRPARGRAIRWGGFARVASGGPPGLPRVARPPSVSAGASSARRLGRPFGPSSSPRTPSVSAGASSAGRLGRPFGPSRVAATPFDPAGASSARRLGRPRRVASSRRSRRRPVSAGSRVEHRRRGRLYGPSRPSALVPGRAGRYGVSCRFRPPTPGSCAPSPSAATPSRRPSRPRCSTRAGGPRSAGLGPDRLGQDRGVRPRHGRVAARRRRALRRRARRPLGLVIAPTRELALQVARELDLALRRRPARASWPASAAWTRAASSARWPPGRHIVVGTPGRLRDHLERGRLDLSTVAVVVLDEADEMLDLGFREELETLLDATPDERRTLLFSATIPRAIAALAQQLPARRGAHRHHRRARAARRHRVPRDASWSRASASAPSSTCCATSRLRGALVFCATARAVRHLHANLLERGFAVVALSGELSQPERNARAAVAARRPRPGLRRHRRRRARPRPARPRPRHPRRPAARPPDPAAPQRPHRPGRPQGRHRGARAGTGARGWPSACWAAPTSRRSGRRRPSADEIRERDQARLVAEVAGPRGRRRRRRARRGDRAPGRAHARAGRHRAGPPAPEPAAGPRGADRRPAEPRRAARWTRPTRGDPATRPPAREQGSEWTLFRLNIGSTSNADPRWLIPLLCKRGGITRHEIGAIRIAFRDTTVEIAAPAAERFAAQAARPSDDPRDRHVRDRAVRGRPPARAQPARR